MARSRDSLTIGGLVESLLPAHPDLTISKVRFLEEEGLIAPERTAGGYRKFSPQDTARVELVLRLQREHFLPLSVIRDKLKEIDKGRMPPELRGSAGPAQAVALPFDASESVLIEKAPTALGLPVSFIRELAGFGIVTPLPGEDGEELSAADVAVAHTCWDLRRYGVEPRHLRMYETFAEREAAFFQQILMPAFRHRTPETRQKLVEALTELGELTGELKRSLLRRAVGRVFEDVT
jgi:DNA-binding transcriptional MerR regulator